jgi:hypothetical protein
MARDRVKWRAVLGVVLHHRVPYNSGSLLAKGVTLTLQEELCSTDLFRVSASQSGIQ